jgi:hypothetical protein
LLPRLLLLKAGDDFVIDIGDVASIDHLLLSIQIAQQAEQYVEHHRAAGIADMGIVVNRSSAT